MIKLTFDELVEKYDRAIKVASAKLPIVRTYIGDPLFEVKIMKERHIESIVIDEGGYNNTIQTDAQFITLIFERKLIYKTISKGVPDIYQWELKSFKQ